MAKEPKFPIVDESAGLCIDRAFSSVDSAGNRIGYRVYYWAVRPDAEHYRETEQFHWHPDSQHDTLEAAQKRFTELKSGARKKSILVLPDKKPGTTTH